LSGESATSGSGVGGIRDIMVGARESLEIGQSGNGNERRLLDDVLDDEDGAAGDGSGDDGGGSDDEPEEDGSKDTRSVAKQKPRILPKTPGHPA